ncbi:MAG: hypothetical protein GY870_20805 [archaeon]|nr:hypothetical protein [archaeon]
MILSTFADDIPQMDEEELRENKKAFEWWYFDIEDIEKEVSLVVQFKRKSPLYHKTDPLIYVEYKVPGKEDKLFLNYPISDYSFIKTDSDATLNINKHSFKLVKDAKDMIKSIEIHINFDKLKIDLNFIPLHQGFKPKESGNYFIHKKNPKIGTGVTFAAPRMSGKGTFELSGKKYEIKGDGYHDHPYGTTTLLNTNAQWYWGRLYNEDITIMYADVTPHKDFEGDFSFIYHSKIDEYIPKIDTDYNIIANDWYKNKNGGKSKYPHQIDIEVPSSSIEIKTKFIHSMEEIMFYNRSKVNFKVNQRTEGTGWIEYVTVNAPRKIAAKIVQFQHSNIIKRSKATLGIL